MHLWLNGRKVKVTIVPQCYNCGLEIDVDELKVRGYKKRDSNQIILCNRCLLNITKEVKD